MDGWMDGWGDDLQDYLLQISGVTKEVKWNSCSGCSRRGKQNAVIVV